MAKCEGVESPGGLACRIHNAVLQERTVQEDGRDAPDMQAWYCPVSGETIIFSAALAPKMHSDFPA